MHYRYENLEEASKYLIVEMNVTADSLAKRKEVLKGLKEKEEKQKTEILDATSDSRAIQREDASNMVFQRKSVWPWMEEEEELKEEMKEAMLMANHVKTQNPSQWQKHLSNHGGKMQPEIPFMSKPTFNKWLKGKLGKPISD